MPASPLTLALLVVAALVAGTVDAIAGGGGLITVPALLAAGLPPRLALGTNKGQSVWGTLAAAVRFTRGGLVDRDFAKATFPAGLLGAFGGAALVLLLRPEVLRPIVLGLLVVVALFLALRRGPPRPHALVPPRWQLAAAAGAAFVLGAYDGFFGPGTGTFLIVAFAGLFARPLARASADAKVVNLASNVAALTTFALRGVVVWRIAVPMALANLCGGWLGAHLAIRGGDRIVRRIVLVVVTALVVKLAFDLAR